MTYTIRLGLDPVPCPRPRLTRTGRVYYPAKYNAFKAEAARLLPGALFDAGIHAPLEGQLVVLLVLRCTRPKTTKLPAPKPDIDNYVKSVLDACNGLAFIDDTQVQVLAAMKEWADPGETGEVLLRIRDDAVPAISNIPA